MNKNEIATDIAVEMQNMRDILVRTVIKRSEYILYEIAPDVCLYRTRYPSDCKGKLVTSLTKDGLNHPVCQEHYPYAMSDPRVKQKEIRKDSNASSSDSR